MFSKKPGKVQGVEHHIPTLPGTVMCVPFQLTLMAMKEALKKEVQTMLALGVTEEFTSPWWSPAVLVPKPDGYLRFWIDFKHLNEITAFDAYRGYALTTP